MKPIMKIVPKSREQVEQEIGDILNGKDRSMRGRMLRSAAKALQTHKTKEDIKAMFVEEYLKKYGELVSGKKTLEQIKSEAVRDAKKAESL